MPGNMLIAHGGGPTPVINSSLRGAVEEAKEHPIIKNIYGARFGAEGILQNDLLDLSRLSDEVLAKLDNTPASALGSCRRKLSADDYPKILECFKKNDIRYFFYNGGNDSMDTCHKISTLAIESNYELNMVGIPKTIDNDLAETDHSPGFGSAARYAALSTLELAMDAASLPIHVVVMETMGRNAGWITASSALFKKAMPCEHLVFLPEQPLKKTRFLELVQIAWSKKRGLLITVSEGIKDENGVAYGDTGIKDGFGHVIPGGAAQGLADLILSELKIKSRSEKPGLLGRVNMACVSALDQAEAREAGAFAVKNAAEGKSGYMVAIEAERKPLYKSKMTLVPLEKVANMEKKIPVNWLKGEGQDLTEDFTAYCRPLLGIPMPDYAYLGGSNELS
jgi:6-phosphofructokinase 1